MHFFLMAIIHPHSLSDRMTNLMIFLKVKFILGFEKTVKTIHVDFMRFCSDMKKAASESK